MVNLTRIYTRTGDDGTTALGDFSRTRKTDSRLIAYADVDEANSAIGVALTLGDLPDDVVTTLTRIQHDLFDVGADLCTPIGEDEANSDAPATALRVEADANDAPSVQRALDRHPGLLGNLQPRQQGQ